MPQMFSLFHLSERHAHFEQRPIDVHEVEGFVLSTCHLPPAPGRRFPAFLLSAWIFLAADTPTLAAVVGPTHVAGNKDHKMNRFIIANRVTHVSRANLMTVSISILLPIDGDGRPFGR